MIDSGGSYGPRTGSWNASLNDYRTTRTDTLGQNVTVSAASSATLTFYLKVTSSETTTTTVYDRLGVWSCTPVPDRVQGVTRQSSLAGQEELAHRALHRRPVCVRSRAVSPR